MRADTTFLRYVEIDSTQNPNSKEGEKEAAVTSFRVRMIIAMLLCEGVVLFAGTSAIMSGYAYPFSILGGIAVEALQFHQPSDNPYVDLFKRATVDN